MLGSVDLTRARAAAMVVACSTMATAPTNAAGTYTSLYTFTGGADGAFPNSSVTIDTAGNIYGETSGGGDLCPVYPIGDQNTGCGTVYKLSAKGELTTLVTFNGPNGAQANGTLALVGNTLFGTTQLGGATNDGVVFSVNVDGSGFQLIHQFNGKDGAYPNGPLIQKGKLLYGTAYYGGPRGNARQGGYGVLFKIHQNGSFTVLRKFAKSDGANPDDIIMDSSGTIYGSTYTGGSEKHCSCGTVFSYVPSTGVFTSLYSFPGNSSGAFPYLGSIDANGVLYGATGIDGKNDSGTLFQLVPAEGSYAFSVLHEFGATKGPKGVSPSSGPILLPNGSLVGTTLDSLYHFDTAFPNQGADVASFFYGGAVAQPVIGPGDKVYGTARSSGPGSCLSSTGVVIGGNGCGMIYSQSR